MIAGLVLILAVVLVGPILIRPIERNIEVFFLIVGASAALVGGQFSVRLVHEAAREPIAISLAVLAFGALARLARPCLDRGIGRLVARTSARTVFFILIVSLGLLSSVITAVIAALVLVEAISLLRLDRKSETTGVVLACFAIGLGAALTPVGEPLGTIAIAALKADFWYLARLLGPMVIVGILIVGLAAMLMRPGGSADSLEDVREDGGWKEVWVRAGKVYLFVAGLVALSWGLRPLVETYIAQMPHAVLFWLNSVSAVVDNATLTAAEIGPSLSPQQQRGILMGLLISGGMLIPGNIPNVVAANRLGITSREWARTGLLTGFPLMLACFLALLLMR